MTAALTEDVPRSMPRSTAGNLHEGFGGQVPQMQGAAEHVRERIRNTRPSARRRRRGRWGAWAPKHRGGFSAALLGAYRARHELDGGRSSLRGDDVADDAG